MDRDIVQLQSELDKIKAEFSEKIDHLEQQILAYNSTGIESEQTVTHSTPQRHLEPETFNSQTTQTELKSTKNTQFSFNWLALFQSLLSILFDWFNPVFEIIQSYKRKGQLPLLILTIVGVGLVLSGFGYLMQWFIAGLGAGGKSLILLVFAFLVIATGIVIRKRFQLDEFANAIVALGLLICFSTIYFAGSVYQILPSTIVIVCYLGIAFLSHIFAYYLNTKILTTIGLIGFTLMPVLSGALSFEPTLYLTYLLVLNISTLWLASRMRISWLPFICLAFSVIAIEYAILNYQSSPSPFLINGFYWIFAGAWLVTANQQTELTHKHTHLFLAIIAANITLLLQSDLFNSLSLSICLSVNAILSGFIAITNKPKLNENSRLLIWLTAAIWSALAIIALFDAQYWGIAWGVEGLLFLVISGKFTSISLLRAGQGLTTIGIITCLIALAPYFPQPAIKSVEGWILIVVTLALLSTWSKIQTKFSTWSDNFSLNVLKPSLEVLEVAWGLIVILSVMDMYLGLWVGALVIPLQFAVLWRSRQCQHNWLDILTIILCFYPLLVIISTSIEVGSFRFTLLPAYGKAAVISLFAQLLLWSEFYRHFEPKHNFKNASEQVRIVFYGLLPICWLNSAFRNFESEIFLILWVSPLLAVLLSHKIKNKWLDIEAKVLFIISAITSVILIGDQTLLNGLIGICGFFACYAIGYRYLSENNQHTTKPFILGCGLISMSFILSIFIGKLANSFWVGFNVFNVYWLLAFYALVSIHQLQKHRMIIYVSLSLSLFITWGLLLLDYHYVSIILIMILVLFISFPKHFKNTFFGTLGGQNNKLFLNATLSISYCCFVISLPFDNSHYLMAPLLVLHGIALLFIIDRSLINIRYSFSCVLLGVAKIAFLDTKTDLIWQKFVLLMGVGLVILISAFAYQKLQLSPANSE
ncbi:DUF2339 domain-containing protein [Shewanella sp. 202IG2-18]|uniref:DUF2339 domain-containing protein n=1 Tax=Parashewanella hymeniacidonis TaxID=2807618 RepID=UPI001960B587|nr:DUF2339 domain-containing protein [Parashewanella hymeniacidonis]MBM7073214.1 DUF2339 domain-containing protein [Parashewanella hymeniacidonis]